MINYQHTFLKCKEELRRNSGVLVRVYAYVDFAFTQVPYLRCVFEVEAMFNLRSQTVQDTGRCRYRISSEYMLVTIQLFIPGLHRI